MESLNIEAVYAFLFNIIVFIAYFSKQKIETRENKIYSLLLISSLVGTILSMGAYYVLDTANIINDFVIYAPRLYLLNLLLWGTLFTMYIVNTCLEKNNFEFLKKISVFIWGEFILASVLMFLLPLDIVKDAGLLMMTGSSQSVLYVLVGINAIISLILIILYRRKIPGRKIIPVVTFILLCLVVFSIQYQNPSLFMITLTITLTSTLMYHTIENPDMKLITELEFAKIQSEKANMAKSDFLASMSHEIRTPLNAIVGLSECLTESDVSNEIKDDLIDISNASQTLLEIVGNVLDINKIESNSMRVNCGKYIFKDEIEKIVKLNSTRIDGKDLKIVLDVAADVPYELIGDKLHIKSILNNLLSNAVKYTDNGLITVTIKCINEKDNCDLLISVQDTGKGIKSDDINKLFNKFERLDTEKNSTIEGTGLGLAITKKLVELMNGKINVESQFGVGSIFMVRIPQKIASFVKVVEDELEIKEKKSVNFDNKKILIVDDNIMNIKVAKTMLKDYNFLIDEALDGLKCLEMVKVKQYDLIFMDIMMPNMSGEEAFEELKKDALFNVPVLALTADAVAGSCEKYINQGFVGYIAKPFSKETMKKEVEKIFNK